MSFYVIIHVKVLNDSEIKDKCLHKQLHQSQNNTQCSN